jgi:3-methyladenine DNA glycosylase/8-oxoguanine DNA glycosylase
MSCGLTPILRPISIYASKKYYNGCMAKLIRRFGFTLQPIPPYNFELTMHKPAGWPLFSPLEVFEKGILWTALHLDNLLLGLKLSSKGSTKQPLLKIEVFLKNAPTREQREAIKHMLSSKLSVHEDLGEFYRMARKDPILKHTVNDLYGMHDTDSPTLFAEATLAILLQMAPLKRSEEMMECVIKNFGETAVFDGRRIPVWPTPEKVAGLSTDELNTCRLGYRAKHIQKLALVLKQQDFPSIEELKRLSSEEAKKRLLELPGIGDYSSDIINPHGGFPIDVWSATIFGKLFYGNESETSRAEIGRIKAEGIRRWGKYAWMAFLYVVHDLERLSKKLGLSLGLQ